MIILKDIKTKAQVKGTMSGKHVIRIPCMMGVMQVLPRKENPHICINPIQNFPLTENRT